jgi:pullulanase-type alpha-1,6-glucosidase
MLGAGARIRKVTSAVGALALVLIGLTAVQLPASAAVLPVYSLVGDLQTELGCAADWDLTCTSTELSPVAGDVGSFETTATVPAGTYGFKVVTDHSWANTAYGSAGSTAADAANIPVVLAGPTALRFVFHLATGRTDIVPADLQAEAETGATAAAPVRQAGSGNQYYFAMTDRFADGSAANNTGGITGADATNRLVTGYDPTDKGFYQGGDVAGVRSKLDYIKGLGTTAIWLTPSFKNKYVQGAGTADVSAGYHGYWITDFTAIDPHFGTAAELADLISAAHAQGMKIYFDIITNHTADVIQYTQAPTGGTYPYVSLADQPYKDSAGNPFTLADVVNKPFPAMDASSFPYTPTVPAVEATVKVPAWLNDVTLYHNRGVSTYTGESSTMGDFGNLDDLMTENPVVVSGMVDIYKTWIDTGIDGFRIDTAKHVNTEFWKSWTKQIVDYAHSVGKPDFFMFGEVYDADATKTAPYVRDTDMSSVLDFSFQSAATGYAKGGSAKSLSGLYASDDYYTTPSASAYALPTFLGNHDMGRIGYFLKDATQPLERDELANDLMFLTRGQPIVYYGDEQGFVGAGGDKDARQSLFPSKVADVTSQTLVDGTTFGTGAHYATDGVLYQRIKALAALRAANPALVSGAQVEQYVADGTGVYAFSRVDKAGSGTEYLVAVNNADTAQSATFTALTPNATFDTLYGTTPNATSAADGTVTLDVPALSSVVLKATSGLPARATGITASFTGTPGAPVATLNPVGVSLGAEAYAETTFDYRVAGASSWTTLGTSDTGKPRVFHTTAGLAAGSLVEYRAVVKDTSGNQTVSSTYATVGEGYGPGTAVDAGAATKVTIPGSHNSAMGCAGDWQPACTLAELTKQASGLYSGTFSLPAGSYAYKVAIGAAYNAANGATDGAWHENYGVGGVLNGANVTYTLAQAKSVTFWYDPATHIVTNDAAGPVLTVAGDFQTTIGCSVNWSASCLGIVLADVKGDGVWSATTSAIPAGSYQAKGLQGLDWATSYGDAAGANVPFTVTAASPAVTFELDLNATPAVLVVKGATPPPVTDLMVTVPGSHNSEMGCAGDWDPACTSAQLVKRADGIYSRTFTAIPAGTYDYKVAIGGTWDVNYGAGQLPGGANISYTLGATTDVTFYYDPVTHFVTSSVAGPVVTAAGDFQSELGCSGDWQPACLSSWMENLNGDGKTYVFSTAAIPAGSYQVKAAYNLGWDEAYPSANVSFVVPAGPAQQVVFTFDSAAKTLTVTMANPPLAGQGQAQADWVDARTIAWPTALLGGADPTTLSWALNHAPTGGLGVAGGVVTGGEQIALTYDPAGLSAAAKAKFPALAGYVALTLPAGTARADIETILTGEMQVSQSSAAGALSALTGVQLPGVLDDLYGEVAAQRTLGISWVYQAPTLALWAPTAKSVSLLLRPDAIGGATETVPAVRQSDGSWIVSGPKTWEGAAYLWKVDVFVPSTGAVETNVVTDPYSVALTTNSVYSMLVDLNDPSYRPQVWRDTKSPVVERAVDRTIDELHVRDFSIADTSVPEAERGTYLAFTRDSDGMKHLRSLVAAGLNTVHLLPTFDIATIEENRAAQAKPACDLASFPADSDQQQACVAAVANADGYNWGYDPFHYQTPEGSYAVNPDGGSRVAEFRSMVGALHASGLQVVLDEVYNHTSASGQAPTSVLDKVVPGYYQRLNNVGQVETSTCCQNVATEHGMAQKLMVDSVVLWAKQYKVDGFRFDLMGHHSKDNMLAVRAALDALTLSKDGVNGKAIYLYGEGWNFGEVANNALFTQASQGQLGGTGIGTFNDRLRDAVHGGSPVAGSSTFQQGFGTGEGTDPNGQPVDTSVPGTLNTGSAAEIADLQHQTDLVRLGLAGNLRSFSFLTSAGTVQRGDQLDYRGAVAGYADQPDEVINYVDAHDNETLFDTLTMKLPTATTMADRVRMNTLSLATVTLSQSPSFWQAGTDLLRSKSLDRNSYNSGDWFNSIDWTGKDNGFGRGLPMAADNSGKWAIQGPLLANPALKPAAADIAASSAQAQALLRLRSSTKLFRLGTADLINQKVSFPGSGPGATPGVVVMSIDDTVGTDVDKSLDGALVVFNASPTAVTQKVSALAGRKYVLAPVQADGTDATVKTTTWATSTGTVTVPARTVAVLVDPQGTGNGNGNGNGDGHGNGNGHDRGPCHIALSAGRVKAGGSVTVRGAGFEPGEQVQVWLHSTPTLLVAATADAQGAVDLSVTIPTSTTSGSHSVQLNGLVSGAGMSTALTVSPAGSVLAAGSLGFTGFQPALAGLAGLLLLAGLSAVAFARGGLKES